jgi:hypothetical protein
MRRMQAALTALLTLSAVVLVLAPAAEAGSVIKVTTKMDDLTPGAPCSLREALISANTNTPFDGCTGGTGADVIVLKGGTYHLTFSGANEDSSMTGDLDVSGGLTIKGAGPAATAISAWSLGDRILDIHSGNVHIVGLRMSGGSAPPDSTPSPTNGGAILKHFGPSLTLNNVVVSGNSASGEGGGVASLASTDSTPPPPSGVLTITHSRFVGNEASGGQAGGLTSVTEAKAVINHSSFSGNDGVGLEIQGTPTVLANDVSASQNFGSGIEVVAATKGTLSNISVSNNYRSGSGLILISDTHTSLKGVVASHNTGSGVSAFASGHGLLSGIHAAKNVQGGVQVVSSNDMTLSHLTTTGNEAYGVDLIATGTTTMTDVTSSKNGAGGVELVASNTTSLKRVHSTRNVGPGISEIAANTTKMKKITASLNAGVGMYLVATLKNHLADASVVGNAGNGIYAVATNVWSLAGVTVAGNHGSPATGSSPNGGGISVIAPLATNFSHVTVKNNKAKGDGGGLDLLASAATSLTDLTVKGNLAKGGGGGVHMLAPVNTALTRARITGNTAAGGSGGGVSALDPFDTTFKNSTIAGNQALGKTAATSGDPVSGSGGGIFSRFGVNTNIQGSTISGNHGAGNGGGLFSQQSETQDVDTKIVNSTISGNSSGKGAKRKGGGLYFENSLIDLLNSTITANVAKKSGGAMFTKFTPEDPPDADSTNDPQMVVTGKNTIIAGQKGGGECAGGGTLTSTGHDLVSGGSCFAGNHTIFKSDPQLAPLADNGGPTRTHLLLPGSPARNGGTNNGCPGKDQRGQHRPKTHKNPCDIGSVEMQKHESGSARVMHVAARRAGGFSSASCGTARRSTSVNVRRRATNAMDSALAAPRRHVTRVRSRVLNQLRRAIARFGSLPQVTAILRKAKAHVMARARIGQVRPVC